MAGELLVNGQQIPVTIFVGKAKYGEDKLVSFQVREKATKHEDQHLNQPRAGHDKQVDGYKVAITTHVADGGLLLALMDQQAQRDANKPIDPISIVWGMKTRDGAPPKAWGLTNVVTEFKFDANARNKRVTFDLDCDCDDMQPVVR